MTSPPLWMVRSCKRPSLRQLNGAEEKEKEARRSRHFSGIASIAPNAANPWSCGAMVEIAGRITTVPSISGRAITGGSFLAPGMT